MANYEVEILGLTKVTETSWIQPLEQATDVSDAREGGVIVTIYGTDFSTGTWKVTLFTAVDRSEGRWVPLVELSETSAPAAFPAHWYWYLSGPGVSSDSAPSSGTPSFARYLRVGVNLPSSTYLTLDVRALLRD